MRINPYLTFNGQCKAAFKFYEQVLGGKIETLMTPADMPADKSTEEHMPAEWRDKILHASLTLGNDVLMGSDAPPDRYEKPQGFSVSIQFTDLAEADSKFHALAENGKVQMPFGKTFWSPGFGMCVDQFGIPWMVDCLGSS
ncbi:MAG: VOC family protein [Pyrinomonadaceae bacterium]